MNRNFQLFCIIDGGIGVAFAVGLLAAPVTLLQLPGVDPDASVIVFARAAGSILLGCGLLMIAFRNSPPSNELVAFLRCFGLGDFLLGLVFLLAAVSGVMNALAYGLAALCIGAALVFFVSVRVAAVPAHA